MCLFKTWLGGWTTSVRMNESVKMNCLFGCTDARDELRHYVECSPLWQIAGEIMQVQSPLDLRERLCLLNPSVDRCVMLALCFQGYHYAKSLCDGHGDTRSKIQDGRKMQASVKEAMKTFVHNFA